MARQGKRDHGKERFWRRMVRLWRRCGPVTVREFCAEHGLSESSFYSWRRTLAERDRQAPEPRRAGARRRPTVCQAQSDGRQLADEQPAFVSLGVLPATSNSPALELVLSSGRVIRVPSGFDAGTLRQLLAVLEEKPAC